jgi:MYXO-CTERM domain-containing protein
MARVWGGLAAAAVAAVAAAACSGGDALGPGLTAIGVGLASHRIDDLVTQAGCGCSAARGGVPSLLWTALGLAAIALGMSSTWRPRP